MPAGDINQPVVIDTSFSKSVGRHFWNIVKHPTVTPSLYPNMSQFLEEVTPALIELEPGTYFEFSTDPDGCTYILIYDAQTEDYFIKRVLPSSPNATMTRLPKSDKTAASFAGDLKAKFQKALDDNNPFSLLKDFSKGSD